jgi:hypothetical protein
MDTVNWIYDEVMATGYYDVYLQEQVHTWTDANQTLSINDVEYAATGATYGPNGDLSAPIVAVNNLGCALVSLLQFLRRMTMLRHHIDGLFCYCCRQCRSHLAWHLFIWQQSRLGWSSWGRWSHHLQYGHNQS